MMDADGAILAFHDFPGDEVSLYQQMTPYALSAPVEPLSSAIPCLG